jgi:hypothetical protein
LTQDDHFFGPIYTMPAVSLTMREFDRADALMCRSKADGRNRVTLG